MLITNRLDKTFGPQMAFSGWIFIVFGVFFIIDWMGILLVLIGIVLATTVDGVAIDTKKRRIRRFSGPFGFPGYGRWENLDDYEGLTVVPWKRNFTTWSRSNRQNSYAVEDFRIFVVGQDRKPAFAVKKCITKEQATTEMDKLAESLHWAVWKV